MTTYTEPVFQLFEPVHLTGERSKPVNSGRRRRKVRSLRHPRQEPANPKAVFGGIACSTRRIRSCSVYRGASQTRIIRFGPCAVVSISTRFAGYSVQGDDGASGS